MSGHLSNPWNYAVYLLELRRGIESLGTGTGFLWNHESRVYLITNWHNLSGCNHITGKVMKGIPDNILLYGYQRVSATDDSGLSDFHYTPIEVKLCESDLSDIQWFEHSLFGRKVDVGAIDITSYLPGFEHNCTNSLEADAVLGQNTSQEIFVIGFPFGRIVNAPAPLWKRGTIALDPSFNPDGLPKMLIDTATRDGMSGSVVVARHIIVGKEYKKKDGSAVSGVLYGVRDLVIGVYSGRHYPDLEKAQLGIVWKRSVIEEIVAARKIAQLIQ